MVIIYQEQLVLLALHIAYCVLEPQHALLVILDTKLMEDYVLVVLPIVILALQEQFARHVAQDIA
jgi:hypothetical protein